MRCTLEACFPWPCRASSSGSRPLSPRRFRALLVAQALHAVLTKLRRHLPTVISTTPNFATTSFVLAAFRPKRSRPSMPGLGSLAVARQLLQFSRSSSVRFNGTTCRASANRIPDRDADSVERRLKRWKWIKIVARDRAELYAAQIIASAQRAKTVSSAPSPGRIEKLTRTLDEICRLREQGRRTSRIEQRILVDRRAVQRRLPAGGEPRHSRPNRPFSRPSRHGTKGGGPPAPIVRARPCPIFGRPVHRRGSPH